MTAGGFQARAREVLPPPVMEVLTAAARAVADSPVSGEELYAVGGVVRDVLLGRVTEDLDLVVVGPAAGMVERIAGSLEAAVESESAFGTWRLLLPGGGRLDLAAARDEVYRRPGALPTVQPGTLEEDLARRDFTINALAVRLGERWSQPIDPLGGTKDLEAGVLRTLHSRSFVDDPTRVLRGLELGQRLGFEFDPPTASQAERALAEGGLTTLSAARFRTAWRRAFGRLISRGETALLDGLERAERMGLLVALGAPLDDSLRRAARRLGRATSDPLDPTRRARLLFRALADADAGRARRLAGLWSSRPRAADEWAAFTERLRDLRVSAPALDRPSSVASALDAFDEEERRLIELLADGSLERLLATYRESVETTRLTISGRDLVAAGFAPGPRIGAALAATRNARLDGLISIDEELEYACRSLRNGAS